MVQVEAAQDFSSMIVRGSLFLGNEPLELWQFCYHEKHEKEYYKERIPKS